jgi:hypothetical protein
MEDVAGKDQGLLHVSIAGVDCTSWTLRSGFSAQKAVRLTTFDDD